ncbi:DUF3786 domain-containing protein [Candidatus Omnitrophota bacterium]
MAYDEALAKAWLGVEAVATDKSYSVQFLADEYSADLENHRILSLSCNVPAKDHVSILILHYLEKKLKGLPAPAGDWISFKQLEGGQGYYSAFKKRAIDPIVRKYGSKPEAIFELVERLQAKKAQLADVSVALEAFESVPALITLSRADEEFGPEANILFDKSITDIFCTEDVAVLAGIIASSI